MTRLDGVYADEDSKILATGFVSGLEADGDKIKLDGTSYKFDNGYSLDTTLVYDTNKDTNAVSLRSLANAADKTVVTPTVAASKIKLIDNDGNGKVDAAVKTPVQVAKVTSVSKTSFSVKYLTAGVSNSRPSTLTMLKFTTAQEGSILLPSSMMLTVLPTSPLLKSSTLFLPR